MVYVRRRSFDMKKPAFNGIRGEGGKANRIRLIIVLAGVIVIIAGLKYMNAGAGPVEFTQLTEEAIPQDITSQIIPEYRDMERALACMVDDKVYVLAARGEKPTTGYDISIAGMELSGDDGDQTLTVNVLFRDPQAGASLTQETTYPYVVAETNLTKLPQKIEMKIKYAD